MKLTAENVNSVFIDCLFKDGEQTEDHVKVKGLVSTFGFHPERIKEHNEEIYSMLKQLPDSFQKDSGGGMSFLNACDDADGNQWTGLHQTMEQLVVLGIGIDKVKYCLSREMWKAFPGEMPYFVVE